MCNDRKEHMGHMCNGPKDPNSLFGLMKRCGHILHHSKPNPDTAFEALDPQQKEHLASLLKVLLDSWQKKPEAEE